MTPRSGHRPSQRLVPRKPTGVMPDENLFEQADRLEAEDPAEIKPKAETIQERFEVWIAANPKVLEQFVELARRAKAAGKTRIGAKLICEVLRWETWIDSDVPEDDDFMLNNIYSSRLARLAVEVAPDLAGMFQFRTLKSA